MSILDNTARDVTTAGSPFDDPRADVILRTRDNVDFRVFKLFLSFASPFFNDMFALPQTTEGENVNETKETLPLITVAEDSKALSRLLPFCYPLAIQEADTLEDIQGLLEVAIKYSVERAEANARKWLMGSRFVEKDPVRVFAIACRHGLQDEAKKAARLTWTRKILEQTVGPELDYITGTQLFQLLQYHRRCIDAVSSVATDLVWVQRTTFCFFQCPHCPKVQGQLGPDRAVWNFSAWWYDHYMKGAAEAMLNQTWDDAKKNDLLESTLIRARDSCAQCYPKALVDMRMFETMLLDQIQDVISEVPLDIKL